MLLSDLVDEYATSLRNNAYAKSTIRQRERIAREFLAHVGNIKVANVTPVHVDQFLGAYVARGIAHSTLNQYLAMLKEFWNYAMMRRHARTDVVYHRRNWRVPPKRRQRVHVSKFEAILDAATHPRDRAVLALGIFCLFRQSEIINLQVGDVDLDAGVIYSRILKSNLLDEVPICEELDVELRRWLTWYTNHAGPLDRTWYLVPAKTPPRLMGAGAVSHEDPILRPTAQIKHPERIVQDALRKCGYATHDESGATTREGLHTLRRSSARALHDALAESGEPQPIRVVQAMLHHKDQRTTEGYLGLEVDKQRRDARIKGKEMFPALKAGNVTKLRREA